MGTEEMRGSYAFGLMILSVFVDLTLSVNVHFENKEGGFFLRQTQRPGHDAIAGTDVERPTDAVLSVERFAVFETSQPISVRATYGPFSTKQTVPARYLLPDPLPTNGSGVAMLATRHLDVSAHVVRREVPRDSPVIRVLFHARADPNGGGVRRGGGGGDRRRRPRDLCIVLEAVLPRKRALRAACAPDADDGVCLAQATVPSDWWPALRRDAKSLKTPPRHVTLTYGVAEPASADGCTADARLQPTTGVVGTVALVAARATYKEYRLADALVVLVPHPPLYPLSRLHIPVHLDLKAAAMMVTGVVVRCRVKNGVRILKVIPMNTGAWNVSVDVNSRQSGATVTLVRKEMGDTIDGEADESVELLDWLIEVAENDAQIYDEVRMVWSARIEPARNESRRADAKKFSTRFDVQKDDIQAVVPISKSWEVLNTAVLTGRQVSQAMKIFVVSQAGKTADVTFQASCHSEDDSVLKVSSSCSSVYVDGSEARGSVNASVLVKYGTYVGLARFTVWMPEFPLDVQVADIRLSQLKGWRVPDRLAKPDQNGIDRPPCRLRYQQTNLDVYAHFAAVDHDTGRVGHLVNRRTSLRVTDLVEPSLRISDPRIAELTGRILRGRGMGRAEVQVLSPITGRVIGAREIRVGNDKVGLVRLDVSVVSGLQLNIVPEDDGYVAETSVTRRLTARYQEGLLDIGLEFGDGSRVALRDVDDADYRLLVESRAPEIVAFAPVVASHHPRVIAVGEGAGDLLQVTLAVAEECRRTVKVKDGVLGTANAAVTVDFGGDDMRRRADILQNDAGAKRDFHDLDDVLGSQKDDGPNVQARQYQDGKRSVARVLHAGNRMTSLEISMYILLAAFCCAIVVFVISCVVYASKFKPADSEGGGTAMMTPKDFRRPREVGVSTTTTNAHEWVWLGRTAPDDCPVANASPNAIRITSNPLNMNYCEPDDCLASFANKPTTKNQSSHDIIDTNTYSKNDKGIINANYTTEEHPNRMKALPPPPVPQHATIASDDGYRPPVPPHRNLDTDAPRRDAHRRDRRHHHHRHHASVGDCTPNDSRCRRRDADPPTRYADAFRFDDAVTEAGDEENEAFRFVRSDSGKAAVSEVKRATIIGNPMFNEETVVQDLQGMDSLQMEMDYDQIMHYFNNLKVQ